MRVFVRGPSLHMKSTLKLPQLILNLSVLIFSCIQIILFALIPILVEKLSLPFEKIIGSLAIGTCFFVWGSPFWARKSESWGRLPVLRIALFSLALSTTALVGLLLFAHELSSTMIFLGLMLSRIIYGVFTSGLIPVTQLLRLDLEKTQDVGAMFSHSFYINVGRTLGLFLLLIVDKHFLILLSSLASLNLLLCAGVFFISGTPRSRDEELPARMPRAFLLPFLITILFTAYVGILHSSLGHTLQNVFSLRGEEATVLMSKLLISSSALMVLVQALGHRVFRNKLGLGFSTGLILLALGALNLSSLLSLTHLWISMMVLAAGIGLIQPSHLALIHRRFKGREFSTKIGFIGSGNTIGYAIGGTLAALFLQSGLGTLSLIIIALLFLCAAGLYFEVLLENS